MRAIFSVDWKRMTSLSWHPLRRILTSRSRDSSGECLLNGQMRLIAFTNLSFCLSARTYRCSCPLVCMLTLIFVLLCYFICFTWIGLLCWPPSCSCYFDWRVMLCDVFFSMKITYCFLFCHEAGYGGWCSRSLILSLPWPWGTAYRGFRLNILTTNGIACKPTKMVVVNPCLKSVQFYMLYTTAQY